MKWFAGSISEAVAASKQRNAMFCVFVQGTDDASVQAARTLDSEEISARLDRGDVVAVRVDSDTESYTFFSEIYKPVLVPSLYFIGTNGVPLLRLVGALDRSVLWEKLDLLLGKSEKKVSSSSLIGSEQSASCPTSISSAGTSKAPGAGTLLDKPETKPEEANKRDLSSEEKLERARQLIELQKRQKMEKEREEEKKREIERRQLGKDVQSLKQKQQEASIKMAYDERMREKAAEAEARERVRRQIAQDKLERKQRELALQQQATSAQQEKSEQSTADYSGTDSTVARIQFRLPSGNPHMGKFDATSTLGSLRSYVAANIELPFTKFAMSTTFPRRDLSVEDDDKSLKELELVPTAVILILPMKNSKITTVATSADDVGFVSRFMWALFAPIVSVYNYVMGYFSGAPTIPPERRRSNDNPMATGSNEMSGRYGRVLGQSSGSINGNLLGGPSTTIRSRGNIHRLHSGGDDNDENNTWNGNSTQQM